MADTKLKIGPADDGLKMTLADFEFAEPVPVMPLDPPVGCLT